MIPIADMSFFQSPVLITGVAGFIGFSLALDLLGRGVPVVGMDNLNDYYDVRLKEKRLETLKKAGGALFQFHFLDLGDGEGVRRLWEEVRPRGVLHMAAQAGVRYSLTHPLTYGHSNLMGFLNVLEACRHTNVAHLVYASSSSVYGVGCEMPFSVDQKLDSPISLYAATKKSNELMAYAYSHLYDIPMTGLRFFTVYGPWGRPDMAVYKFTKAILEEKPIELYNQGQMLRDFTYIDDIVAGTLGVLGRPPVREGEKPPVRLLNIGHHQPVPLLEMVEILEDILGKKAQRHLLPNQAGDVPATYADIADIHALTGFWPRTSLRQGLERYVRWYEEYRLMP